MDDDAIREFFAGLGEVTIRKMFGGKGVYHHGVIVGVTVDGELLLKADRESAPDFAAGGARQWSYDGKGRPVLMPYWSIPDSALDDPEEMTVWTRKAYQAALRSRS
jgi:DNA transformation protein and related proteins